MHAASDDMHRFVVGEPLEIGKIARLGPSEAQHALRVLRLKAGANMQLIAPEGTLFTAELLDSEGEFRVIEAHKSTEPPIRLTLYQGLPKFEKLELIAQKATEMGVSRIVPVRMSRCVVKLNEKDGEKRRERLSRICKEASKQSGRAVVPEVLAPVDYKQMLNMLKEEALPILCWEEARGKTLAALHTKEPNALEIGIVIGPEGGISEPEAQAALDGGAHSITLGPRILRTETAAIAAGAIAMSLWGDI